MDRIGQFETIQCEARELFKKKNGIHLVSEEGLRDTLIDLHNYSAMALLLLDEDDPSVS